jgi:hypothetical protein
MHVKSFGFVLAALVLGGVACSKSGQVTVSAKAATASATDSGCALSLNAGDICVTEVQMEVKKVALEGQENEAADAGTPGNDDGAGHTLVATTSAADHGSDDGQDDDDADEVKVGPCTIDLSGSALGGTLSPAVCQGEVPAGTFRELKVVIAPVDGALSGDSVIINGTFKGVPFTFTSKLNAQQKRETNVTVDASTNVTLTIDPTNWFTGAAGTLDPNAVANQQDIEQNIRASIRAFCDHDRDGQDDDSEHGADGGHHG